MAAFRLLRCAQDDIMTFHRRFPRSTFGLCYTIFGLRYTIFGLRYTIFGLR
jgi:hypothetical protein